jgi:arylsulfatase A-like enzyme
MKALLSLPAVVLILAGAAARGDDPAGRPNIVLIMADDLGYADLGVHGCTDIPTPHIDSLAENGVRAAHGYVSGPYCSPTRAGLMTGRYQQRYGHEFNPGGPSAMNADAGLPVEETTLPEVLREAGYTTGMVGKWHLGHAEQFQPPSRGFESFFGFWGGAHSYLRSGIASDNPIVRGREPVEETEYLTDAFAREAVAFIDEHQAEPFFLYLAFNAVHGPMEATEEYTQRFESIRDPKRRTYAGMMTAMDDAIGDVLAALERGGLSGRTLIFFIADNGGPENVNASDNGAFRGQKAQTWEGGIHVPYLVRWPDRLPAGEVYEQPVIQLDVFPTVLAAAGVEPPQGLELDGVNLLPYLTGENEAAPHDALYWRFGPQIAIRMGDWKLVKGTPEGQKNDRRAAATLEGAQLYNLADDVGEQHDLSAKHPDKVEELSAAWTAWNAELVPAKWGPPVRNRQAAYRRNQD